MLILEHIDEVIGQLVVKIFTTEVSVTSSWENLKDFVFNAKKWHVKCTTSKIKYKNVLFFFLVHAICDRGSCWLIDNSLNVESSNCSGVLCCLSLGVIEISWNCDNGMFDFLANVRLSNIFHFLQDHSWDLFWWVFLGFIIGFNLNIWLSIDIYNLIGESFDVILDFFIVIVSSNKSLDNIEWVFWILRCLIFCGFTYQDLSRLCEGDLWGCNSISQIIWNDFNSSIFVDSDCRVCGSKINSDNWSSDSVFLLCASGLACGHEQGSDTCED